MKTKLYEGRLGRWLSGMQWFRKWVGGVWFQVSPSAINYSLWYMSDEVNGECECVTNIEIWEKQNKGVYE